VGLDLVAEQHRGGVVVARLALRVRLDLDDAVDDPDRILPLLVLGVDVEQRVEERVVLGWRSRALEYAAADFCQLPSFSR
jgi:hypothetical protein